MKELNENEFNSIPSYGEELTKPSKPGAVIQVSPAVESTAAAVISSGQALQQVKTSYVTAVSVQKPRQIGRVKEAVLAEAKEAGAGFYYGWNIKSKTEGKKRIEGPSIDLAMCLARNYGNCALEISVGDLPKHYEFRASMIDLETGFTLIRLFRQRRSQTLGSKMDSDRQEDIVFQIGQSKASRNVIIKGVPGWLVDQAIEEAKDAELKKVGDKNLPSSRDRAVSFFSGYGVTIEQMESTIGKKKEKWDPNDIVELRGMMTALKEGRATSSELFSGEAVIEAEEGEIIENTGKSVLTEVTDTRKLQDAPLPMAGNPETMPLAPPGEAETGKKSGRPAGSKNKPKEQETAPYPMLPTQVLEVKKDNLVKNLPPQNDGSRPVVIKCPETGKRPGKATSPLYCARECKLSGDCISYLAFKNQK